MKMPTRSFRWLLFSLAVLGFAADQASKYRVFSALYVEGQFSGQRDWVPGWFRLFAQYDPTAPETDCPLVKANGPIQPQVNHGALFSLGGEYKTDANRFFCGVSVLAAIGISIWGILKKTGQDRWLCLALGLILGGTLGNLFDRIIFGGVRDFLHVYFIRWPVFNVADCCLVVGAGILLLQAFLVKPKKDEPAAAPAAPSPPAD